MYYVLCTLVPLLDATVILRHQAEQGVAVISQLAPVCARRYRSNTRRMCSSDMQGSRCRSPNSPIANCIKHWRKKKVQIAIFLKVLFLTAPCGSLLLTREDWWQQLRVVN